MISLYLIPLPRHLIIRLVGLDNGSKNMIGWLFGLSFNLYLIYMTYSFPPIALWSWVGIFAITSILFSTAKDRITGNDEKSIEEQRASYDWGMAKSIKPKKKLKRRKKISSMFY